MLKTDGCVEVPVEFYEATDSRDKPPKVIKTLPPVKYGDETRYGHSKPFGEKRCPDCNAKPGQFHHPGCDIEECPGCHHQLLMCGGDCEQK